MLPKPIGARRRLNLDQAEQNLRDSRLVAAKDGVVLARYVNSRVTVAAGQRVLRFADTSLMSVELGCRTGWSGGSAQGRRWRWRYPRWRDFPHSEAVFRRWESPPAPKAGCFAWLSKSPIRTGCCVRV